MCFGVTDARWQRRRVAAPITAGPDGLAIPALSNADALIDLCPSAHADVPSVSECDRWFSGITSLCGCSLPPVTDDQQPATPQEPPYSPPPEPTTAPYGYAAPQPPAPAPYGYDAAQPPGWPPTGGGPAVAGYGYPHQQQRPSASGMYVAAAVLNWVILGLLILGTCGLGIVAAAWFIPMTIFIHKGAHDRYKHTALGVCTLLFCGVIPGILMLVEDGNREPKPTA